MDAIKDLLTGPIGAAALAGLLGLLTGMLAKKKPDAMKAVRSIAGETGEALIEVAAALGSDSDGGQKITTAEMNRIVKESRDVVDLVAKVFEKKREKEASAI